MRYGLRYGYGWTPFTLLDALFVLGCVLTATGTRRAIFGNPQYRFQNSVLALLGLLLSVPFGIYLRRRRRAIQELE
jgi:LPXTG-motif cell wall-anchored protein